MSLCLQSFNYYPSSNVKNCLNKHTILLSHRQAKKNQSSSMIIRQSNGIGIGIIGGVSVDSSLNFAKKMKSLFEDDQENMTPFVHCCDPTLRSINEELLSLERNYFAAGKLLISSSFDQGSIVEELKRERMFLEKSGVCCLVMPCDLLHCWYDEIERGCCVRFLHVGECVAKELKEAKLRPIEAGSPIRIGVLATNQNLVATFYQEKLQNEGFEVIFPDKATIEHTVIPAVEALNRKDYEGAKNLFRIALQVLLVRPVNKIILASNDLRQLLPPDDFLWTKCIDPMDSLARSSIEYAQSAGKAK